MKVSLANRRPARKLPAAGLLAVEMTLTPVIIYERFGFSDLLESKTCSAAVLGGVLGRQRSGKPFCIRDQFDANALVVWTCLGNQGLSLYIMASADRFGFCGSIGINTRSRVP